MKKCSFALENIEESKFNSLIVYFILVLLVANFDPNVSETDF